MPTTDPDSPPTPAGTGDAVPPPAEGFDLKAYLAQLPHLPGVYRMHRWRRCAALRRQGPRPEEARRVVLQQDPGQSAASRTWCERIAGIETTVTRSEAEALLLENNLIKTLGSRATTSCSATTSRTRT
jgi:excinuclease ABC subunit C